MFLEEIVRPLRFLHLAFAVGAVAVIVHFLIRLRGATRGRHLAVARLHGTLLLWTHGVTFALGSLLYPTFRVRVRAELLDATFPWATGLFEAKEHLTAAALAAVLALWWLSRGPKGGGLADRRTRQVAAVLGAGVLAINGFAAWVGWLMATIRPL